MKTYMLFVEYLPLHSEERRFMPPVLVAAAAEDEASRMAMAIAEVAYPEMCADIVIRLVESGGTERLIGEIRRPIGI